MDHAGNRVMPVLGASSGVFGGTEECMVPERIKNGNILGGRRDTREGLHGIDETKGALLLLTQILCSLDEEAAGSDHFKVNVGESCV